MSRDEVRALIRALRADLAEDTATFAQRWRKSRRTVENWEQGRGIPDAFLLERIRQQAQRRGLLKVATR